MAEKKSINNTTEEYHVQSYLAWQRRHVTRIFQNGTKEFRNKLSEVKVGTNHISFRKLGNVMTWSPDTYLPQCWLSLIDVH